MTEPFDPFDILRDLNPVAAEELGDPATSPEARRALERILGQERRRRRVVPHPRKSIYVLVAIVLLAGVGAAAWALTAGTGQRRTIGCYESVDLQARTVVVAVKGSPIGTCRAAWTQGRLGKPVPARLEACILPSGAIGVFPSPVIDACQKLHLVTSSREPSSAAAASVARLSNDLVAAMLAHGCLGGGPARAIVDAELAKLALPGWQVRVNGAFSVTTPCASIAVDDARHLVLVVPVPKP